MRFVTDCNPNKRGCYLCADVAKIKFVRGGKYVVTAKACPYDVCPYHELDDAKCYSEYDRQVKKTGRNLLEAWLQKVFSVSEKC